MKGIILSSKCYS